MNLKPPLLITPPIIAHRGASCHAPENTLASFLIAKELGAKWVEFDVMLSHDAEVIVIHDDMLERTTNGVGRVCDYSYAELKKLDAGEWFSAEFSGTNIPTLREVILLLGKLNLSANIEIKPAPGKERETAEKSMAVIQEHWPTELAAPLISSFSRVALTTVRHNSAASLLGFLMHEWYSDWQLFCDQLQCVAVNLNDAIVTPERVQEIKATNRLVLVYVVNNAERAQELFSWGVDAVFSDDLINLGAFL